MQLLIHLLVVAIVLTSAVTARADVFDPTSGGSVAGASATEPNFPAFRLIDGSTLPDRSTIFADENGPAGTVDGADLFVAGRVLLSSVTLYTLADGGVEDGPRGVSNFRLLGLTSTPNGPFLPLLDGVNPRDDGSPNTYVFEPVELIGVFARFTRSTDLGPRVVELDGFTVPEPHTVSLLTAGLAMLLLRRKRRTA
jgi:hypothetical protein